MYPMCLRATAAVGLPRLAVLLLLIALVLATGGFGSTPQVHAKPTAQEDIPHTLLGKTVEAAQAQIMPGDNITYVTRLHYTGDRGLSPEYSLTEVIPWPLRLAGRVEVNVLTPGLSAEQVRVTQRELEGGQTSTIINWRGALESNAEFEIRIPVQVQVMCRPGQSNDSIMSEATLRAGDRSMTQEARYTVTCPPQASLDDVEVALELIGNPASTREASVVNARGAAAADYLEDYDLDSGRMVRIHLTNNGELTLPLAYVLAIRHSGETDENPDACESQRVARGECGELTRVILYPGESQSFEVWADMRPLSTHLNRLEPVAADTLLDNWLWFHVDFHYLLLPAVQLRTRAAVTTSDIDNDTVDVRSIRRSVRIQAWDVGDAPDSSNHYESPMHAYPDVRANFPTVHDPTVNPTQIGPAHARPRHFHLGRTVSTEVNADVGIARNIDPVNDIADLDLYDDGVAPHMWDLQHCQPIEIEARIFISPQSAAWFAHNELRGYLNGWIDANRDGDWGDVLACDDGSGPAFEHFIIDEPIDVIGLGPGYHTASVTTGRVYWPQDRAQDPAWIRLTLSERPSVKVGSVGSVQFGDGRGPARPFLLGETEDYLLRPAGAAKPDIRAVLTGAWRYLPELRPDVAPAATDARRYEVTWLVDSASDTVPLSDPVNRITFDVPAGLRGQDAEITLLAPRREEHTVHVADDKITVDFNGLSPGERARLLVSFRPEIGDEVVVGYTANAEVAWSHLTHSGSHATSFKIEIEGVTQGAFGFRSPGSPILAQQGTTNSGDLILQGHAPNRRDGEDVVRIWVHSLLDAARTEMEASQVYEAPVDEQGRWTLELNSLPDGFHQFAVGSSTVCFRGPEWWEDVIYGVRNAQTGAQFTDSSTGSSCGRVVVDSTLPINPIGIGFAAVSPGPVATTASPHAASSTGRIYYPDTLNWRQGEWSVRLPPGEYLMLILGVDEFVQDQSYFVMDITGFGSFETKLIDPLDPLYIPDHQGFRTVNSFIIHELEKFGGEAGFIIGDGGGMPGSIVAANRETEIETDEVAITLELITPSQTIEYTGSLGISRGGQVVDRATGEPIAGATVLLLAINPGDDGSPRAIPWDGREIGQPNPVFTDENGRYFLTPPAGRYQLLVAAEGYHPFRSNVVSEGGHGRDFRLWDVALTQVVAGEPSAVVSLHQDYIEPAVVTAPPHSLVQFINLHSEPRRLFDDGAIPADARTQTPLDSGWLLMGESFTLYTGASGEYSFSEVSGLGMHVRVAAADEPEQPDPDDPDPQDPDPNDDNPNDEEPGDDPETPAGPAVFLPQLAR